MISLSKTGGTFYDLDKLFFYSDFKIYDYLRSKRTRRLMIFFLTFYFSNIEGHVHDPLHFLDI